jgi:hypothetical protein
MFITIARLDGASRGICGIFRRVGQGECCGYSEVSVW